MSASPSPRPGPIALGRCPAGCVGRRPSCARSGSRSPSTKEGQARTRIIHITASAPENAGAQPSAPSAPSASSQKSTQANDFAAKPLRTVADNADGSDAATVRANPLKTNPGSAADGADANPRPICAENELWLEGAGMSAALALKTARAVGIRVRIDGDDLELEAPAQPPQAVLDLLSLHKADILRLLRPANDGWSPEDWQGLLRRARCDPRFRWWSASGGG